MEKIYNVLIIEDYQIIIDVYKNALKSIEMNSQKKKYNRSSFGLCYCN